jgi:exodeoxyribonuclease VII large subunit
MNDRLNRLLQSFTTELRWSFKELQTQLERNSPLNQIQSNSQRVDELDRHLAATTNHLLQLSRIRLTGLMQHMAALNPMAVLERGYSIVTDQAGETIARIGQVSAGDGLNVKVSDGDFDVHVDG